MMKKRPYLFKLSALISKENYCLLSSHDDFDYNIVLFDYWIFHNRSSKIFGREVSMDDRL